MNKKVNTLLFIVGASVFNLLTMLAILVLGMYLSGLLLSETARESAGQFVFIIIIVAAIGGSFFTPRGYVPLKYISESQATP